MSLHIALPAQDCLQIQTTVRCIVLRLVMRDNMTFIETITLGVITGITAGIVAAIINWFNTRVFEKHIISRLDKTIEKLKRTKV